MNISSETLAFPINNHAHRRVLPSKHSSMFVSASPIAVNNKIRAIQTRKPRITLQSYYDFTDIRPLNFAQQSRISNSTTTFSNLSPEKLVERSKELRLGRIAAHQNPRTSVLSSTSNHQQSLVWPSYNSPTGLIKENQVDPSTVSPNAPGPTANKLSTGHIPDIHQRPSRTQTLTVRQPFTEQQNNLLPIDSRHKSLPKTKASIPKAYDRAILKTKSPFISSNLQPLPVFHNDYFKQLSSNVIQLYESEEEDENVPLVMDEEFEEYLQKAVVKCADWLIKYVFDKTYENDE